MNVVRRVIAFILSLVGVFMLVAAFISTLGPGERVALVLGASLLLWIGVTLLRRAEPATPAR